MIYIWYSEQKYMYLETLVTEGNELVGWLELAEDHYCLCLYEEPVVV